jgi:hypothetical protein
MRSLRNSRQVRHDTGRAIKYTNPTSVEYLNDPTLRYYIARNRTHMVLANITRISAVGSATFTGALFATGSPGWATVAVAITATLEYAKRKLNRAETSSSADVDRYLTHKYGQEHDFAHRT